MEDFKKKYEVLAEYMKNLGSVGICFSGGVDSTLLVCCAKESLAPGKYMAFSVKSKFISETSNYEVEKVAKHLGINHKFIEFDVTKQEGLLKNPENRCYICKKAMMQLIKDEATKAGVRYVVEGTNTDDLSYYRPGKLAIEEEGIISPLLVADISKEDVRNILKWKKFYNWDKPSNSCLATRLCEGEEITDEKLSLIELGEEFMRGLGFESIRVKPRGSSIVIKINSEDREKYEDEAIYCKILEFFKKFGYSEVKPDK